jgi:AraC-like DNA-binding protein
MNGVDALWVDHCLRPCGRGPMHELALACRLTAVRGSDDLLPMVREIQPALIVFDFDYPDTRGLRTLLAVRKEHGHIPVLMLVEPCYDGVLLWALRARVWDVLIKPVRTESLLQRMHWLRKAALARDADGSRANAMPIPAVPMAARFSAKDAEQPRTAKACRYVEAHLHEKMSEAEVARCCGLSRCEFSRAFHEEHGVTFRQYLRSVRMRRAVDMLERTDAPIMEIAFCVGFRDPSHFASQFRCHAGCSPSVFRDRQRAGSRFAPR